MKRYALPRSGIAILVGLGIGLAAQAAPVAKLTQIKGKVLVNMGKEYLNAQPGMELSTGDRVLALQGASVRVVYPDNCTVQVNSNSLFTLGEQDQCYQASRRRRARYPRLPASSGQTEVIIPAEETGAVVSATEAGGVVPSEVAGAAAETAATETIVGAIAIGAVVVGATTAAIVTNRDGGGGGRSISPE